MLTLEPTHSLWKTYDELDRAPAELLLASGERARIARKNGDETLEVLAPNGELIFAYDPVNRVLFYTEDNFRRRDLLSVDLEGNKSRMLFRDIIFFAEVTGQIIQPPILSLLRR